MQKEIGERGLLHLTIPSATDYTAGWTMKVEDLMVASLRQPSFLRDLFGLFQGATLAQTEAALQAGIQVIFSSCYFASLSAGWSPAFYREFIWPLLKEQADLVHRYGGVYHFYDDGRVLKILPWLAEAGIDILSTLPPPPVGDIDLAEAKAMVGDSICLNGNIDIISVVKDGSPELIEEKVREAILAGGPGGGFILGTSDSIRDAPIMNVRAYFAAARRYGNYPDLGEG
jgi:uroporphyrinogen-III decarboxylase